MVCYFSPNWAVLEQWDVSAKNSARAKIHEISVWNRMLRMIWTSHNMIQIKKLISITCFLITVLFIIIIMIILKIR